MGAVHVNDSENVVGFEKPPEPLPPPSAITFHGNWTEFAKIALTNMLLTICTLGFYRFWATTRERQYLWSKTRFIDEPLEWTGNGMELFIGFILVFFLIIVPFGILQLVLQGAIFQGQPILAGVIGLTMFIIIFYLGGVAYYRALRYRLSRTYWRGIRGGSNDPGFQYGLSYMWKSVAAAIPLYLLYPWAQMSLWNERWNKMSFGPYQFQSDAEWTPMMKRYMLFYLAPFLLIVGAIIAGINEATGSNSGAGAAFGGLFVIVGALGFYIVLPIAALLYYSKFLRVAVSALRVGDLEFEFKARSPNWLLYYLASMGINMLAYIAAIILVMIPIGIFAFADVESVVQQMQSGDWPVIIGLAFTALLFILPFLFTAAIMRYIRWSFFVKYIEAYGEVNLDNMTQSETENSKHGEGLLDAFDVGAI